MYFTRGWGETFRLPTIAAGDPPVYLLVNEISDHLPVYSWGPYVQRAFELMADGYSLASTMHADTVSGVIEQLTEECDVPVRLVGELDLVVPMYVGAHDGRRIRRVSEIGVLEPLGPSYDEHTVVRWSRESDAFAVLTTPTQINALARRLGMEDGELIQEVARYEQFLEGLIRDGVMGIDDVQERVSAFAGHAAE